MSAAHTVINNFMRKGFNLLGHGCYAAVFESNTDPNLVYKVGAVSSDPFLVYIQAAGLKDNPHFPKIYEIMEYDNWYLVKMERLEPIPYHKTFLSSEIRSIVKEKTDALVHLAPTPELQAVAAHIRKLSDDLDVKIDLHQGNIMMRGLVPVITDPLCHHDIESEWALENWFGQKNKKQRNASWSY